MKPGSVRQLPVVSVSRASRYDSPRSGTTMPWRQPRAMSSRSSASATAFTPLRGSSVAVCIRRVAATSSATADDDSNHRRGVPRQRQMLLLRHAPAAANQLVAVMRDASAASRCAVRAAACRAARCRCASRTQPSTRPRNVLGKQSAGKQHLRGTGRTARAVRRSRSRSSASRVRSAPKRKPRKHSSSKIAGTTPSVTRISHSGTV